MLHKLHKQGIRRRKKHIIVVQLISSTLVLLPLFRYFRVFSSHYLYSFHKPFCKLPHPIPLFFTLVLFVLLLLVWNVWPDISGWPSKLNIHNRTFDPQQMLTPKNICPPKFSRHFTQFWTLFLFFFSIFVEVIVVIINVIDVIIKGGWGIFFQILFYHFSSSFTLISASTKNQLPRFKSKGSGRKK